jgi:hypothetical protein
MHPPQTVRALPSNVQANESQSILRVFLAVVISSMQGHPAELNVFAGDMVVARGKLVSRNIVAVESVAPYIVRATSLRYFFSPAGLAMASAYACDSDGMQSCSSNSWSGIHL